MEKKLLLFTRQNCVKCDTYKNFAERYNVIYELKEEGDHDAELLALELHIHNVPQFVIQSDEETKLISIEDVVALVDEGEFVREAKVEVDELEDDLKDFYEE